MSPGGFFFDKHAEQKFALCVLTKDGSGNKKNLDYWSLNPLSGRLYNVA
jgi:hypothetical protein